MKDLQFGGNPSEPLLRSRKTYSDYLPSFEMASKWIWYNNVIGALISSTFNYVTDDWLASIAPGYALLFINGVPFALGMIKSTVIHNASSDSKDTPSPTAESKSRTAGYLVKLGLMHTLNTTAVITQDKALIAVIGGANALVSLGVGEAAQKGFHRLWSSPHTQEEGVIGSTKSYDNLSMT